MNSTVATRRADDGRAIDPVNREWIASIVWGASPTLTVQADLGHVPSTIQDGRVAVLFDGLLHNRPDLEVALTSPGEGVLDEAELLLRAYRRWGTAMLEELSGFFSLLVCDGERGEVIAARDPLGSFPLFWSSVGRGLHFSQSIDVLLRHPQISRNVNRVALADQLCRRWPDPEETFFEAVRRIPPGRMMVSNGDDRRTRRYWTSFPADRPPRWVREDELGEFDRLFSRAVERCIGAGRTAIYLSGGLDSISIATVAAEVAAKHGSAPLTALSLSYPDPEINEVPTLRAVAGELGMPQLILGIDETVGEDGILLSALKLSSRMPSPLISIMAPSFRALDVEAKRLGCDYIVTGAGGDELLTVAPVLAADLLRSGDVHGLYRLACATRRSFSMGWPTIARQLLWSRGLRPLLGDVFRRRFPGWMARRHDRWVDENTPDWVAPDPMLRQAVIARGRASDDAPLTEPFYVHDYTRGIDRASIANEMDEFAADGRLNDVKIVSPFFDKDLFDFASRVPPDLLYRGGMSKSLIREVLAKRYPALHFERQKKVFAFKYLRQQLVKEGPLAWRAMNGPMLLAELGIIRRSAVNEMMGRIFAKGSWVDADRAWEILNLEAWVRGREGRPTIEKG